MMKKIRCSKVCNFQYFILKDTRGQLLKFNPTFLFNSILQQFLLVNKNVTLFTFYNGIFGMVSMVTF